MKATIRSTDGFLGEPSTNKMHGKVAGIPEPQPPKIWLCGRSTVPLLPGPGPRERRSRRIKPVLARRVAARQAVDIKSAFFEDHNPDVPLPDNAIRCNPKRFNLARLERSHDVFGGLLAPALQFVTMVGSDFLVGQHPAEERLLDNVLFAAHKTVHCLGSFRSWSAPLFRGTQKRAKPLPRSMAAFSGGPPRL